MLKRENIPGEIYEMDKDFIKRRDYNVPHVLSRLKMLVPMKRLVVVRILTQEKQTHESENTSDSIKYTYRKGPQIKWRGMVQ